MFIVAASADEDMIRKQIPNFPLFFYKLPPSLSASVRPSLPLFFPFLILWSIVRNLFEFPLWIAYVSLAQTI